MNERTTLNEVSVPQQRPLRASGARGGRRSAGRWVLTWRGRSFPISFVLGSASSWSLLARVLPRQAARGLASSRPSGSKPPRGQPGHAPAALGFRRPSPGTTGTPREVLPPPPSLTDRVKTVSPLWPAGAEASGCPPSRSWAAGTSWAHLSRARPGIRDPGPAPAQRPTHRADPAASPRLCRSRAGPRGVGDSALPLLQPPPPHPGFCSTPPAPGSERSRTRDPAASRPAGDPATKPLRLTSGSAVAPRPGSKSRRLPACCLPSRWPAALPPPSAHPRGPRAHSPAPAPARPGRGVEGDVR